MNYRHHLHAGNVADVFKHQVLTEVQKALASKETPFCVIDTHAGTGRYRLKAPGEFEQGIDRLWPGLAVYFALLAPLNEKTLTVYPGSPWIMRALFGELRDVVFAKVMQRTPTNRRDGPPLYLRRL